MQKTIDVPFLSILSSRKSINPCSRMQKMSPIFTLLREFTVCIVDNGLIKPYGLDGLFELTQDPCSSALSQQPILCVSDSELMRFLAFF